MNPNPQQSPARRGPKPNAHTRENLIRAGVKMFHESGYAATGIQDIVDAAEVPKGSFYNHFKSKEAFGAEVVDLYFGGGLPELRARLQDSSTPPRERLRAHFDRLLDAYANVGYERGCLMGNLSVEIADHSDVIRERIAGHFRSWSALIEACIAEAQQAGTIRNRTAPSLLANVLLNSWEGALVRMRVEKSGQPLREFVEVAFASLLA